jgi:HSP20 family protein
MEDVTVGATAQGEGLPAPWSPPVDVYETENAFVLTAEVPGIEQDEVDLQVKDHVLLLKGRRNPCSESSESKYYRLERPSGTFERRFSLPDELETDKIHANLSEGVLTVTLPKRQRRRVQSRRVEVRRA